MKVTLLCHGATAAMRTGAFPAPDEPLDPRTRRRLGGTTSGDPGRLFSSPSPAARETADALSDGVVVVDALRDIDHGGWAGRSFEDVHAATPAAFERWLACPWEGTPGGETFAAVAARAGAWIDGVADGGAAATAVTHPTVIRALLSATIGLPAAVAMRIDILPLTACLLSHHRGWRLQRVGMVP